MIGHLCISLLHWEKGGREALVRAVCKLQRKKEARPSSNAAQQAREVAFLFGIARVLAARRF